MSWLELPTAAATEAAGERLAAALPEQGASVIHLHGDLGAGKSTLARALLRRLGVRGSIRSPTYTLVERYPLPAGECLHLDLYRIGNPDELDYLGLDALQEARLWLIEWPERGGDRLPPADLLLRLGFAGAGRVLTGEPRSDRGRHLWAALDG